MKLHYAIGTNSGTVRNGLRLIEINDETGRFHETGSIPDAQSPIYLARSADGRRLYVAELHDGTGCVAVYEVSPDGLRRLQALPCAPTVPCHISLSPDGRFLLWAEYSNAWTGAFVVEPDGLLRGPTARVHHTGHGPNAARQASAHCHYAAAIPAGDQVRVCDLGTDTVKAYRLTSEGGFEAEPEHDLHVAPGQGPRHLVFHPNGKWAYLVSELASTVLPLRCEGRDLVPIGEPLSMLPPDFTGTTKAAAIRISPDGTQLVASNRGHDSLAVFRIDSDTGALSPLTIQPLRGRFPRDFVFLPNGKFLLVAHKLDHEFASYAYDSATGAIQLVQRSSKLTLPLAFQIL